MAVLVHQRTEVSRKGPVSNSTLSWYVPAIYKSKYSVIKYTGATNNTLHLNYGPTLIPDDWRCDILLAHCNGDVVIDSTVHAIHAEATE